MTTNTMADKLSAAIEEVSSGRVAAKDVRATDLLREQEVGLGGFVINLSSLEIIEVIEQIASDCGLSVDHIIAKIGVGRIRTVAQLVSALEAAARRVDE